jgi:sporulation protein YlmC with PRC-barrel domain
MKKNLLKAAVAILGVGSICAADVQVNANANGNNNGPKVDAEVRHDNDRDHRVYTQEPRPQNEIRNVNRAQKLVGMEVRNRDGDKLGEVKDVVLDLQSGRVAYVAVSVGGFLGIREKLIAVPANAIVPSESGSVLILDASKGDIQDAPGFAATNWPDYRSAQTDVFFHPRNRGTAAGSERGGSKLYTDANSKDHDVRVEANTERDREIVGRVKSINGNTIVVDANGRLETFSLNDNRSIRSSDYRIGDRIVVKYHSDNGRMMIDTLSRP